MQITKTNLQDSVDIHDTLFGEMPLQFWANANRELAPWTLFKSVEDRLHLGDNNGAAEILRRIIEMPGVESRHYLQAYHFLSEFDPSFSPEMKLYGVLAEISMEEGQDVVVVYADHTARYYNYSGKVILWDAADSTIEKKIDHILNLGQGIVQQIGPWTGERRPAPEVGYARINFLTSRGLHFGEAPQSILFRDPLAGNIMIAMMDITETLIDRVTSPQ